MQGINGLLILFYEIISIIIRGETQNQLATRNAHGRQKNVRILAKGREIDY
jgi:hypothetical protein